MLDTKYQRPKMIFRCFIQLFPIDWHRFAICNVTVYGVKQLQLYEMRGGGRVGPANIFVSQYIKGSFSGVHGQNVDPGDRVLWPPRQTELCLAAAATVSCGRRNFTQRLPELLAATDGTLPSGCRNC